MTSKLGALTAATMAVALVFAGSASAAKLDGKTTLAPKAATFEALAAEGVTVAPVRPATAGGKGISFPITRGNANLDRGKATIRHSGGLRFTEDDTSLTVKNFVVKLGRKDQIQAKVPGAGKVRLADLDISKAKIKESRRKIEVSRVKVLLAKQAAEALSATFGLPDLTGAVLGKATVKVKL